MSGTGIRKPASGKSGDGHPGQREKAKRTSGPGPSTPPACGRRSPIPESVNRPGSSCGNPGCQPVSGIGAFGPIPDLRSYFNAAMWRFRTGSPWRDVPESYGPWSRIYDRFRMWA